MNQERLVFLFQRYVNQTCTPEESREFMHLVTDNRNHENIKELIDDLWNTLQEQQHLSAQSTDRILESIFTTQTTPAAVRREKKVYFLYKVAATLLLLVAIGMFYTTSQQGSIEPTIARYDETLNEHRFVKLPDGSTVLLNECSTLKYPDNFDGATSREVVLTGEGFFDIQPDASKPFIVHTGSIKTTVLGTAFNIKAYDQEKDITVTVTRGKVEVSSAEKLLGVLTINQQISVEKGMIEVAQKVVDSKRAIAWGESDIFFDDITLGDAAKILEDRFKITVKFDRETLKLCRFTATFVRGEDLTQILEVISQFNNANYTFNGSSEVFLNGSGCLHTH